MNSYLVRAGAASNSAPRMGGSQLAGARLAVHDRRDLAGRSGVEVANVSFFTVGLKEDPIPPDGTSYFAVGPADDFAKGAITVTALPRTGTPGANLYMEVVQMATRQEAAGLGGIPTYFLDVVVRNNSHASSPNPTTITSYDVLVSVVTP